MWYSLLNPDKGSIWFLVGLATRACVDLGYHNEHNVQVDQLDALELDMRRRLFWCTYKMDRLLSQSLGRPPSIPDGFINVPVSYDASKCPRDTAYNGASFHPIFTTLTSTLDIMAHPLANHAPTKLSSSIQPSFASSSPKSFSILMVYMGQLGEYHRMNGLMIVMPGLSTGSRLLRSQEEPFRQKDLSSHSTVSDHWRAQYFTR